MNGKALAAKVLLVSIGAGTLLGTSAPVDAQEASWFHIRVEEPDVTRVSLDLPLALVEIGLEAADGHLMKERHTRWDRDGKVSLDDIRRMWAELREAGDADFVEIVDGDSEVRLSRRGDRVLLTADEGRAKRVRIEMPSAVVDALLGVEGDRLDLRAAIQELARTGRQELLDIRDGETTVRIWIDDSREVGGAP